MRYIEDIIGILSGDLSPGIGVFRLASQDIKVLDAMAFQVHFHQRAFGTDQAALAIKLIKKYKRQLKKQGIDVTDAIENPTFKFQPRTIDRTTRCWLQDDLINLKFPYSTNAVSEISTYAKNSHGMLKFDPTIKVWQSSLTEDNIIWLHEFAKRFDFEIADEITELVNKILAVKQDNFVIELTRKDGKLTILNAPDTLLEYISAHVGEVSEDNLLRLIDHAPVLGYSVGDDIDRHPDANMQLMISNRGVRFNPGAMVRQSVEEIIKYATDTGRFPIYCLIDDPLLVSAFSGHFKDSELAVGTDNITEDTKLVVPWLRYRSQLGDFTENRCPLLITDCAFFSGKYATPIAHAEKIFCFTHCNPMIDGEEIVFPDHPGWNYDQKN
jgi:hypothetical protein